MSAENHETMGKGTDNARSPIAHNPVVAVGHFSDGLASIWTGLVLNLTGFYPLIVFLSTWGNPSFLHTMGAWLLVSLPLFIGIIVGAFGVKERGYQKKPFRVFGVVSLSFGVMCFLIPVVASLLYSNGIGQ